MINYLSMTTNSSELRIALTQGQYCIIDPIDADLAQFKWCAAKIGTGKSWYVTRCDRSLKPYTRYIHREILERIIGRPLVKTDLCDHINMNALDNRRCNIRLANHFENARNYAKCKNPSLVFTREVFEVRYGTASPILLELIFLELAVSLLGFFQDFVFCSRDFHSGPSDFPPL